MAHNELTNHHWRCDICGREHKVLQPIGSTKLPTGWDWFMLYDGWENEIYGGGQTRVKKKFHFCDDCSKVEKIEQDEKDVITLTFPEGDRRVVDIQSRRGRK